MYSEEEINAIYDKTHGCCHLCHKKLAFVNYGKHGEKGSWHIDHSKPKAKGGTNRANNLLPACISCNLSKGTSHTKTVRKRNGVTRAPLSAAKKKQIKNDNMIALGTIGFIVGAALGFPAIGTLVGCVTAEKISPKK
jgi:hypothetical protein